MRQLLAVALAALLVAPPVTLSDGVTGEGFEFDGEDVTVPFSPTPAAPTPLWRYVLDGNADGVDALLAAGAQTHIEVRDDAGHTALTYTASSGRLRILNALLLAGADVAAESPDGVPPLVLAARAGHRDPVDALVNNGADPDGVDFNGLSALWHAARQGALEMAAILLASGATTEHRDHQNYSPLTWAALQGRTDIMDLLLMSGADPNILNELVMDRLWASEVGCNTDPQYDAVAEGCPSAFHDRTLRHYAPADMVQRLEDAIGARRLAESARGRKGSA